MPLVEVNGVKINYAQIGKKLNPSVPDVVMIHGLATNMAFWYLHHAMALSKFCRVTLYDLRGHGRSGMPPEGYSPSNMSRDLRLLLDHLGIGDAHFIAHSFGGVVALNLACENMERFRSLILVDSHIDAVRRGLNGTHWEFGKTMRPFLQRHGLDLDSQDPYFGYKLMGIAAELREKDIKVAEELEAIFGPMIVHSSKRTVLQWQTLIESTRAGEEMMGDDNLSLNRLRKLTIPIMAVYGEDSPAMSTGRHLLKIWSHAQFYRMRNAGHFFPLTAADEFAKRCRRFLKGYQTEKVRYRIGDNGHRHFRSDRFYRGDNRMWFVDTREAKREGPFNSIDDAKAYLSAKLRFCRYQNEIPGNPLCSPTAQNPPVCATR